MAGRYFSSDGISMIGIGNARLGHSELSPLEFSSFLEFSLQGMRIFGFCLNSAILFLFWDSRNLRISLEDNCVRFETLTTEFL